MRYIMMHQIEAVPMTRGDYNKFMGRYSELKGFELPANENPADEGYRVTYPDGYVSWCPKAQFEAAGRPCDGMTFGMAVEAMKRGAKVARKGWNGKGMWLCVPLCDGPKEIPATGIWGKANAEYAEKNGGTVKVMPYVTMKTADGAIVMGWLASQTDMLAEDWEIVL